MDTIKQLKETAEARILSSVKNLESLQSAYGIEKLKEVISLLQEIRTDLFCDLDETSK